MTSRDFCYWLQGYFEIAGEHSSDIAMSTAQVQTIQKHLNLVFAHEIDPSMGEQTHQNKLNSLHGPAPDGGVYRC